MKRPVSPYNPANILTVLRILLVPVFIVLMQQQRHAAALACFVLASITDFVDGWLARRFEWTTRLGQFIDPLGDKMLTLAALVMLTLEGRLAFWVTVAAFAREMLVVTGYVLLAVVAGRVDLKVSRLGKAATLFEMVSLSLVLAAPLFAAEPVQKGLSILLAAAVLFNFVSGLDYAVRGLHDFEKNRRG